MTRWLLWLGLFACFSSNAARAAAPGLHWVRARGAEGCIEPAALAERVQALTGTAFVAPAQAELSLEGLVEPAGEGFRVRLVSARRGGPRSAERLLSSSSKDCREVDAAVAFVIALTIDPGLALAGVPAEVLAAFGQELPPEETLLAELEKQEPAPVTQTTISADPAPTAPGRSTTSIARTPQPVRTLAPPRYGFGLAAAALGGSAPGWLGGVRGSFALSLVPHWQLGLSLGAFPSLRAQPIAGEHEAVFQSYDATLSVCPGLAWGRWRGLGCLGFVLGYLHASGRGFDQNRSAAVWDPAAAVTLGAGVRLAHGVGLFASATMRVRLLTHAFELSSGAGEVQGAYRPRLIAGLFSFGPSYEF